MDTVTAKFGTAREKRKAPVANRLFAMKDLPDKGINFHPNYLRGLVKKGLFPKPSFYLSPRKPVWTELRLDTWIASKIKKAEA